MSYTQGLSGYNHNINIINNDNSISSSSPIIPATNQPPESIFKPFLLFLLLFCCVVILFYQLSLNMSPLIYGASIQNNEYNNRQSIRVSDQNIHLSIPPIPIPIPTSTSTSYNIVNQLQQIELEHYDSYTIPPKLVPTFNRTFLSELKSLPIRQFNINTKKQLLFNPFDNNNHVWIAFGEYLQQVEDGYNAYTAGLSSERQKYQKQLYQAKYATHISLSTTPPTIKFSNFIDNTTSIYNQRPKITKPIPILIHNKDNYINTTNPFKTYLTYNSTQINQRRYAVAREIAHAFGGYSLYSMGSDEFFPLSMGSIASWGIGLTIIDSLDTLMLSENEEYVDLCIEFIANNIKFYPGNNVSVFETTIRGLGGLLSAYAQRPEHTVLLERAYELGTLLFAAFGQGKLPLGDQVFFRKGGGQLKAETSQALTLQLEFESLARFTGDKKFALAAREVLQFMYSSNPALISDQLMITYNQIGAMTSNLITTGARADSTYEYYIKLWVLHGRPPFRLPLRNLTNPIETPNRPTIIWMNNTYTPNEQDILWDKYEGLYDEITGVYIPLHLYYQFLLHFPSLFVLSGANSLLFPSEIHSGKLLGKHDHLVCFLGGLIAYGIAHGAHDNIDVISQYYHTDCVSKEFGIPCDFINTNEYYSYQTKTSTTTSNYNTKNDFISIVDYIKNNYTSWSHELTHTCVQTYAITPTQCAPDETYFNIDDKTRVYMADTHYYSPNNGLFKQTPLVQDLYELFRHINNETKNELDQLNNNDQDNDDDDEQKQQKIDDDEQKQQKIAYYNQIPFYSPHYIKTTRNSMHWFPPGKHWIQTKQCMISSSKLTPTDTPSQKDIINTNDDELLPLIRTPPPGVVKPSGKEPVKEPLLLQQCPIPQLLPTPIQSTSKNDVHTNIGRHHTLLRPETVESLLYMWRMTKHEYYREVAWSIFLQFVYYGRIHSGGYSSIANVSNTGFINNIINNNNSNNNTKNNDININKKYDPPSDNPINIEIDSNITREWNGIWDGWERYHNINIPHEELYNIYLSTPHGKNGSFLQNGGTYGQGPPFSKEYWSGWWSKQESFFIAETLKYLYLIFDDDNTIPFDQYVFNTEAHPIPINY